jgi:hypothetical protein
MAVVIHPGPDFIGINTIQWIHFFVKSANPGQETQKPTAWQSTLAPAAGQRARPRMKCFLNRSGHIGQVAMPSLSRSATW